MGHFLPHIKLAEIMSHISYVGICLISIYAAPAMSWWDDEHRTIAIIAENHLSKDTRKQLDQLVGDSSLEELSLWADGIKSDRQWAHTKAWHYVNFDSLSAIQTVKPRAGGDIFWALEHFYAQLTNPELPPEARRQALQFFIHYVADVHQPLHVGSRKDRGGNRVRVTVSWFGAAAKYNLHQVWDGLLTGIKGSAKDYAQQLDTATEGQIHQWQQTTFRDWMWESYQLLDQVYNFGDNSHQAKSTNLDHQYLNANRPVAEQRLLQAGIRLAYWLNRAFATDGPI